MLETLHALHDQAREVEGIVATIPADAKSLQVGGDVIRAAAADMLTAYDKYSSAPGDMARLRLSAMIGSPTDLDAGRVNDEYAKLMAAFYPGAGTVVRLAPRPASDAPAPAPSAETTATNVASDVPTDAKANPPSTVYLADLKESAIDCWTDPAGRMVFHKRVCDWNDTPIAVDGNRSPNGLFTHPRERGRGSVRYALDGQYATFTAEVGIADDQDPQPQSPVTFTVVGDGRVLWTPPAIATKRRRAECSVDIHGIKQLELVASAAGSHYFAHAVWLEPRVERAVGK